MTDPRVETIREVLQPRYNAERVHHSRCDTETGGSCNCLADSGSAIRDALDSLVAELVTLRTEHDKLKHQGEPVTIDRIKQAHSRIDEAWVDAHHGRSDPIYKQGHDEQCYFCALIYGLEAAEAENAALRTERDEANEAHTAAVEAQLDFIDRYHEAEARVEALTEGLRELHHFLWHERETFEPPEELREQGYVACETMADYDRLEELTIAAARLLEAEPPPREDRYRRILEQIYDSELAFQTVEDVRAFVLSSLQIADGER